MDVRTAVIRDLRTWRRCGQSLDRTSFRIPGTRLFCGHVRYFASVDRVVEEAFVL